MDPLPWAVAIALRTPDNSGPGLDVRWRVEGCACRSRCTRVLAWTPTSRAASGRPRRCRAVRCMRPAAAALRVMAAMRASGLAAFAWLVGTARRGAAPSACCPTSSQRACLARSPRSKRPSPVQRAHRASRPRRPMCVTWRCRCRLRFAGCAADLSLSERHCEHWRTAEPR